jgi:hemerythrin-like metal-binding protein
MNPQKTGGSMFIEWHPSMSVGIDLIDEEHKKLVDYLNTLHESIEKGSNVEVLTKTIHSVMAYTVFHFNHEESMFLASDYPEKAEHVSEHKKIAEKLMEIQSRLRLGHTEQLSLELLLILKEWLVSHIQQTDMRYVKYLRTESE